MPSDLEEARKGNGEGPLKAAMDVLRDIRDTVRSAVDFGGLLPASYQDAFLGEFAPMVSLLAAGPPPLRTEQAMALMRAGILRLVGPNAQFGCDATTGRFTVSSAAVDHSEVQLRAIVDSRIPLTNSEGTQIP